MRVLVVDDHDFTLVAIRQTLESHGCIVKTSNDMWILNIVKEFQPDILIMDVNLGYTASGPVTLKAMNKRKQLKGICTILHSSESESKLATYKDECGVDGYIQKAGMDLFYSKVKRIYDKGQQ
jgi:CheY-like chemotaxis protein